MSHTKLASLTAPELRRLYHKEKMSQWQIAKRFAVTQGAIMYWMKKWHIPARSHDDSLLLLGKQQRFTGPKNPNWNGGRLVDHGGYILVRDQKHHRADNRGYVKEHIKVWEKSNGKRVPKGWQVHHINGNKKDNRPENLVALSDKKHRRVIPLLQSRIRRLEKQLVVAERSRAKKSHS